MQARLSAVQKALVLLPVVAVVLAVLARPHLENRGFSAALSEVSTFRASFDRSAWKRSLREHAEAQGALPLQAVASAAKVKRGPKVGVAEAAASVRPLSSLQLASLAEILAHAQAPTKLTIGTPDVEALGSALSWRLAHGAKPGPFVLTGVELAPANLSQADVDLEREAAELRLAQLDAQADVDEAGKRLEAEERLFEARRKRHLPWKIILTSIEARNAARVVLDDKTKVLAAATKQYEAAAVKAEQTREIAGATSVPEFALAKVTFTEGAVASVLMIPVALQRREVVVPTLPRADFSATRAAGLWEEVKDADAEHAIATIRGRFNWHYRYAEVLGIKLGGMTVLQLLPCLLPLLLLLLSRRIRAAGKSYSPFSTKVRGSLPYVGLKYRGIEWVALVLLPLLVGAGAAASLLIIGQVPVLPVISAVACLMLGGHVFVKLGELRELVASVAHSHSYPPPGGDD